MYEPVQTCKHCGATLTLDDLRQPNCGYCGTVFPHQAMAAQHAQVVGQVLRQMHQAQMHQAQMYLAQSHAQLANSREQRLHRTFWKIVRIVVMTILAPFFIFALILLKHCLVTG